MKCPVINIKTRLPYVNEQLVDPKEVMKKCIARLSEHAQKGEVTDVICIGFGRGDMVFSHVTNNDGDPKMSDAKKALEYVAGELKVTTDGE
jgi:hypothetical protein